MGGAHEVDVGHEDRLVLVAELIPTDADLGEWEGVHQVRDPNRAATYMRIGRHRYRCRALHGQGIGQGRAAPGADRADAVPGQGQGSDVTRD